LLIKYFAYNTTLIIILSVHCSLTRAQLFECHVSVTPHHNKYGSSVLKSNWSVQLF